MAGGAPWRVRYGTVYSGYSGDVGIVYVVIHTKNCAVFAMFQYVHFFYELLGLCYFGYREIVSRFYSTYNRDKFEW